MTTLRRVAVLGFGTMGSGIAHVVARSGRDVVVLEAEQSRIDTGWRTLDAFLSDGVRRGKTTDAERSGVLSRITTTTDMSDLRGMELVIEAVSENLEIKQELFGRVAKVIDDDALLTTNTSALSVTELAAGVPEPQRFAGLHFFNPAPLMGVVEIVRALQTEDRVVTLLDEFVHSLRKTPVPVEDRPGFLVNRLLIPYLNDVIQEYDEELATAEDIDLALELGLGYKMGPLSLLDLIGIDVHLHATEGAYAATLDPEFAAPPLLRQMVAAGYWGTKTGRGFRTSSDGI